MGRCPCYLVALSQKRCDMASRFGAIACWDSNHSTQLLFFLVRIYSNCTLVQMTRSVATASLQLHIQKSSEMK